MYYEIERGNVMIEIKNLVKIYNKGKTNEFCALKGIDLSIEEGEMVAIIGKSGAGKSTLLHILAAIDSYDKGSYLVDGVSVGDLKEKDRARFRNQKIGIVMQDYALIDEYTIEENVQIPLIFGKVKGNDVRREKIMTALENVGLAELAKKPVRQLSGGQKQRVAIAGVIAMRPDCLILDESTAMLDPRGRAQVMKTIRNLRDAGISIVSITHYMEEAAQADRILVMSRGRIVMEGTPKQVFSQTKRLHGYHLDVPQATELRDELAAAGLPMPENIITPEECAKAIFDLLK